MEAIRAEFIAAHDAYVHAMLESPRAVYDAARLRFLAAFAAADEAGLIDAYGLVPS